MKIDIKEISKISLAENELLWITICSDLLTIEDLDKIENGIKEVLPEEWRERIVVGTDKLKLTKITKEG